MLVAIWWHGSSLSRRNHRHRFFLSHSTKVSFRRRHPLSRRASSRSCQQPCPGKDGCRWYAQTPEQRRAIYPAGSIMNAEVAMLAVSRPLVNKSMPWGPGSPSSATLDRVRSAEAVLQQESLASDVSNMINLWSRLAASSLGRSSYTTSEADRHYFILNITLNMRLWWAGVLRR